MEPNGGLAYDVASALKPMRWPMKLWMAQFALTAAFGSILGCGQARPDSAPAQPPSPVPSLFNPAAAGTIRGKVVWNGDLPDVPPFEIRSLVTDHKPPRPRSFQPNPNAPSI